MKQLLIMAKGLCKEAEDLENELWRHNPGIEQQSKKSLITIAASAGRLAYRYAGLRTELIKRHERNQLYGI